MLLAANNLTHLISELSQYSQKQFTGRIDIENTIGRNWSLYLNLGFLVWARGGEHPSRRWRRQLFLCKHPARSQRIVVRAKDKFECWDYHILTLLAQRQAISESQVTTIINGIVQEVLFDIFLTVTQNIRISIQPRLGVRPSNSNTGILRRSLTLEMQPNLKKVASQIKAYQQYKILNYLPDSAPRILQIQRLRQEVNPATYQKLTKLLTGEKSIRDLAVLTQQSSVNLTRSLAPFMGKHLVGLVEISDLSIPYTICPQSPPSSAKNPAKSCRGFAICIEDNPRDASEIENVLEQANYQCQTIQDVVQALPTLLQSQPDIIFLDLVMPIVNGYELCGQIRRIQKFQNTPIVIVTGRDTLVDRMRAKVVGATDFLSKPIEAPKLLSVLDKYCHQKRQEAHRSQG